MDHTIHDQFVTQIRDFKKNILEDKKNLEAMNIDSFNASFDKCLERVQNLEKKIVALQQASRENIKPDETLDDVLNRIIQRNEDSPPPEPKTKSKRKK